MMEVSSASVWRWAPSARARSTVAQVRSATSVATCTSACVQSRGVAWLAKNTARSPPFRGERDGDGRAHLRRLVHPPHRVVAHLLQGVAQDGGLALREAAQQPGAAPLREAHHAPGGGGQHAVGGLVGDGHHLARLVGLGEGHGVYVQVRAQRLGGAAQHGGGIGQPSQPVAQLQQEGLVVLPGALLVHVADQARPAEHLAVLVLHRARMRLEEAVGAVQALHAELDEDRLARGRRVLPGLHHPARIVRMRHVGDVGHA